MSWNARRYIPGKPVLRAVRHRKKILSQLESRARHGTPATTDEISTALMYASDHGLDRWMEILQLAANFSVVENHRKHLATVVDELEAECGSWKFKYLQERQKVLALEAKIGYLRRSRQSSRTRMRAGTLATRSIFPSSRR